MTPIEMKDGEFFDAIIAKQNGGQLTNNDLRDLIVALYRENKNQHNDICESVKSGISAHDASEHRIEFLEGAIEGHEKAAIPVIKSLIAESSREVLEKYEAEHKGEYIHMTPHELEARMVDRNQILDRVSSLEKREGDPEGEAHGEDNEMGDIRRAWRTLRWFVAAFVIAAFNIGAEKFFG